MTICVICGGDGFTLYDGLCRECNGTGECYFDCDAIVFEDGSEDIYPNETPKSKLFQYHEDSLNLRKAIERKQFAAER